MEIKVPNRLLGNTLNKKLVHCPEALKFNPSQQDLEINRPSILSKGIVD